MTSLGIHILGDSNDFENVILVQDKSITFRKNVIYEHPIQLTSVSAVSPGKPTKLALTDVEKNLLILEEAEDKWKKVGEWKVPKCPTSCAFFKDLCYVGDKFGQVFVYPPQPEFYAHVHLSEDEGESSSDDEIEKEQVIDPDNVTSVIRSKPLMGHVSMLTKLVVTERFIITADRDEKIRVTDRLKPYVIHAFLLNHTSYVSDLFLCNEELLISTDGVGRICWWNLTDFSLVRTHELKVPIRQIVSPSLFIEDDSCTIHRIPEGQVVFEEKVHCANYPFVSTLSGLYKITDDDKFQLLQSCEQGNIAYEAKGRIAKRPLL